MPFRPKISIGIPNYHKPGRYFNVLLRNSIVVEPDVFREPDKVVVVANVQGRFMDLVKLLIGKKVVDKALKWCFGNGHLVILGNVSSELKGIECLWLIYSMEEDARLVGGHVHFVPGRTDLQVNCLAWHGQHPNYARKLAANGEERPAAALFGGNHELLRWMRTKKQVKKIGNFCLASDSALCHSIGDANVRKLLITVGADASEVCLRQDEVLVLNDNPVSPLLCLLIRGGNVYRLFLDKPKEAIFRA